MATEKQWARAGLSLLYYGAEWDPDRTPEASRAVQDYIDAMGSTERHKRRGLWLGGPAGTGKTHLAHLVADAALDRQWNVRMVTIQGYMDAFRRRMDAMKLVENRDPDANEEYWHWESFIRRCLGSAKEGRIHLLVIDDLFKEHTTRTRFAEDEIERLIRSRGMRALPTVVTTNADRAQVAEAYDESFDSFVDQAFVTVPVVGEDQRRGRR